MYILYRYFVLLNEHTLYMCYTSGQTYSLEIRVRLFKGQLRKGLCLRHHQDYYFYRYFFIAISYLNFPIRFLAPTGALEEAILSVRVCVCVCVLLSSK